MCLGDAREQFRDEGWLVCPGPGYAYSWPLFPGRGAGPPGCPSAFCPPCPPALCWLHVRPFPHSCTITSRSLVFSHSRHLVHLSPSPASPDEPHSPQIPPFPHGPSVLISWVNKVAPSPWVTVGVQILGWLSCRAFTLLWGSLLWRAGGACDLL